MHATLPLLADSNFPNIKRDQLETLQINLGYRCNQQCFHCHVNANPKRKENMSQETAKEIIELLDHITIKTIDLTGGAPELNENFRTIIEAAHKRGIKVMDRCNLTILSEPGQETTAEFLAQHQVEVIASLPCYTADNVDSQRGDGVFMASIAGLRQLNKLGYGQNDSPLVLNLVYNPLGAYLPPPQASLESDYKKRLQQDFNVYFNQLFTLTNMPIKRFGSTLISDGKFNEYMQLLKDAYLQDNLKSLMCRNLVSVDWQGYLYDCDFNQMLELPLKIKGKSGKRHVSELKNLDLSNNSIVVADHCFGCTAGQGSSCGGALS